MNKLEHMVQSIKRSLNLTSASPAVVAVHPFYDFILNRMYGRQGLLRVINGEESLRVRPAHRYDHEEYEPEAYAYLKRSVKPGGVVLDVGAHVGVFTIMLARWVGPTGHVYAFEPTPQTRAALEDHLVLNEVADRVTPVPMAVSDAPGTARFYVASNSLENTLNATHSRIPSAEPIDVPVTTIDDFCAVNNLKPTLVKLDVEGFELHALRGARQTLASHRPTVVVEMHPMNWPEIGISRVQAAATLDDLGYRAIPLEGQTDPLAEYGHVTLEPVS